MMEQLGQQESHLGTKKDEVIALSLQECIRNFLRYMKEDYPEIHIHQLKKMEIEQPAQFKTLIDEYERVILSRCKKVEVAFREKMNTYWGVHISKKVERKEITKPLQKRIKERSAIGNIKEDQSSISLDVARFKWAKRLLTVVDYKGHKQDKNREKDVLEIRGRVLNVILRGYDVPLQGSTCNTILLKNSVPQPYFFNRYGFQGSY